MEDQDDRQLHAKHWVAMPEFHQEKQQPYACVNVRFASEAELAEFCRITGMKLTARSKSAWFPEREDSRVGFKRWA